MNGSLNFILLYVKDLVAARAFYLDVMGLTIKGESESFIQFNASEGASFALNQSDDATPTRTIELWWQVPNADELHSTLVARGVEVASAPQDMPFGRAFTIRDPEGNALNFYQPHQG
jgi:predicted enzyme related to lactoylglutathione lyase